MIFDENVIEGLLLIGLCLRITVQNETPVLWIEKKKKLFQDKIASKEMHNRQILWNFIILILKCSATWRWSLEDYLMT